MTSELCLSDVLLSALSLQLLLHLLPLLLPLHTHGAVLAHLPNTEVDGGVGVSELGGDDGEERQESDESEESERDE